MSRRARVPAVVVLDLLAEGKLQKEIAYEHHLTPAAIESVLITEKRRQNCRTTMQLVALHVRRKMVP